MQNTGLARRFAAILYDGLLVFALLWLPASLFIALNEGQAVEPDTDRIYQLVLGLVIFAYFVGFWSRPGRTLGMQSWGLQLETEDGEVPSLASASLRFFAALISWLPLGLGFLWQLWDPKKLTWHDRISKTHVTYYPREKKTG